MTYQYSFKDLFEHAERITWRVEDIIGGDKTLDFSKPFMPESLARTVALTFLSSREQRILNQIRGHAYLSIFGLVEEFIIPFVLDHARSHMSNDDFRVRALLEFASEEAKHIQLFHRFRDAFRKGFAVPCGVIGPPEAISKHVLSHHPLSVGLAILQIEWMTQRHYAESIKDARELDPQFKSMLHHHWMEEMQHAQLDTLMVQAIAETMSASEIAEAIDGYTAIGGFLDAGLSQQMVFDGQALESATGRRMTEAEWETFMNVQRQANRWTFLGSGMSHPKFLETLSQLSPEKQRMIASAAAAYS